MCKYRSHYNTSLIIILVCIFQAHSSVERAALLAFVQCHKVESDDRDSMKCEALRAAIEKDKADGLVPFLVRSLYVSDFVSKFIRNCYQTN